jgi:pimeloyl-ACP methyl ester carboxylesterase
MNLVLERGVVAYHVDGTPELLDIRGTASGSPVALHTTFANGSAVTVGRVGDTPLSTSMAVPSTAVLLPDGFFGAYAWLGARLASAAQGATIPAFIGPLGAITIRVDTIAAERMQVATSTFVVRRFGLTVLDPRGALAASLTTAADGSLLRFTIPASSIDVVREDLATSTARTDVYSNPGDEAVVIAGAGFNIGATITRPAGASAQQRLPAVVLNSGADVYDRDGVIAGVPIMGEMAGALASGGFLVVRYDRRGYGQSGGRAESATISDYADDLRSIVQWLGKRDDVDPKRIAVLGHGEGGWIALLAASRDKRIGAVVTIDTAASTGAELVLEQQQHALDLANTTPADRDAKVALQKQIETAVITGKGWEGVPAAMRRQADTPWFQSMLLFDPSKVVGKLRQPLLVVHGDLDRQVPVTHADRLAGLVRQQGKSRMVEVAVVHGVNHLLVPAKTGEVSEYGTLQDRTISPQAAVAITGWLRKTFASIH